MSTPVLFARQVLAAARNGTSPLNAAFTGPILRSLHAIRNTTYSVDANAQLEQQAAVKTHAHASMRLSSK